MFISFRKQGDLILFITQCSNSNLHESQNLLFTTLTELSEVDCPSLTRSDVMLKSLDNYYYVDIYKL